MFSPELSKLKGLTMPSASKEAEPRTVGHQQAAQGNWQRSGELIQVQRTTQLVKMYVHQKTYTRNAHKKQNGSTMVCSYTATKQDGWFHPRIVSQRSQIQKKKKGTHSM